MRQNCEKHQLATAFGLLFGTLAVAVAVSVPASADPDVPPCNLGAPSLCRFIPMMPDLDDDVDLTNGLPPTDPKATISDSLPVDPCSNGCV